MKIGVKLALIFLFLSVLPILIVSFFSLDSSRKILKNQIGMNAEAQAIEKANGIALIVKERLSEAKVLSEMHDVKVAIVESNLSYSQKTDDEIQKSFQEIDRKWIDKKEKFEVVDKILHSDLSQLLSKYLKNDPVKYGEIFVTDVKGATVAMTRVLSDYYQADEEWWISAYDKGRGKVFIDDRGFDESIGTLALGIVVPVKDKEKVIGILKINYKISSILNIVAASSSKESGLDSFLASPHKGMIASTSGRLDENLSGVEKSLLTVRKTGWVEDEHNGKKFIMGYSPVPLELFTRIPNQGEMKGIFGEKWQPTTWYLFTDIDEEKAFASISLLEGTLYLAVLILVVAIIVLAFFIVKSISDPIKKLTKGTEIIGKGNLDYKIGLKTKGEFGQLSNAFDLMTDNLRNTTVSRDKLQKEEEKIRLLLESTVEGIFGVDLDGNCTFTNPSCLKILGYDNTNQLLGKNMCDLIRPTQKDVSPYPAEECMICKAFSEGKQTIVDDEVFWHADGTSFQVEYRSHPIWHDKKVIGAVVTFMDITEKKKANKKLEEKENQLRQSQKMEAIGTLTGGIAHDFNNMLTSIIGYTELTVKSLNYESDLYDNLQKVLRSSYKARDIVSQLMTFSRTSKEEKVLFPLSDCILDTLDLIASSLPSNISIEKLIDKNLQIVGNETQIQQVLMNLCINAGHAMLEGGTLKITLKNHYLDNYKVSVGREISGYYTVLSMEDSGIGMDKTDLDRIFEPFFTTKEVGKGTGLGLSTAFGIVKQHEGYIAVDSKKGIGTTFHVYLPAFEKGDETMLITAGQEKPSYKKGESNLLEDKALNRLGVEKSQEEFVINILDNNPLSKSEKRQMLDYYVHALKDRKKVVVNCSSGTEKQLKDIGFDKFMAINVKD